MTPIRLAFIGGSGIYSIDGMSIVDELAIKTPFGKPSDKIMVGAFEDGSRIAFLPRHGRGHRLLPTEVNSRANIWALKSIGVESIVSLSAVGSLREEIAPRHLVIPDQLIDRTRHRPESSFFGEGIVGHVSFADPYCGELRAILIKAAREAGATIHDKGTLVCMEGPMFSTRAESLLYRSWNASIIGMTVLPEAKLAREAEIAYATLALVTDYDCWRETGEAVHTEMVVETMGVNNETARRIVRILASHQERLPRECRCSSAAQNAVMTDRRLFPKKTMKKLALLYGKYWTRP
ncbi:MAG TPA: S-methyl-5'-thioadenosine phosphorylase [Spirochaetota bacterium]|nr:S-methyl-5'-thioadenosine phosphorylase [Spirochaetota bacterium]HPN83065.1 S-methyl-5'-thioadenosine phosphorylase [Spirochaetota bacterium]